MMETLNAIIRDMGSRNERFLSQLSEVENLVMVAVADNNDALADRDIDAVAEASTVAANLFTAAHALALGLSLDSPAFQKQLQEALVGLSTLADRAFYPEDEEEWETE